MHECTYTRHRITHHHMNVCVFCAHVTWKAVQHDCNDQEPACRTQVSLWLWLQKGAQSKINMYK